MRFTNLGLGGRGEIISDINVTPLVAVLLVLLINLMLFVPLTGGSNLQLPRAAHAVDKPDPKTHEVTVVTIAPDRRIFVNSVPVSEEDLAAKVAASLDSKKDKTISFEGDEEAPYSAVMAAVDSLRKAQIKNISLIVREDHGPSGSRHLH